MDRQLIKKTDPNGGTVWVSPSYDVLMESGYTLIRREYRDGRVEWFATRERTPTEADLFDPKIIASLQLGYLTRTAVMDAGGRSKMDLILDHLYDVGDHDRWQECRDILSRQWLIRRELWDCYYYRRLCETADRMLEGDGGRRTWYELGAAIADRAIERELGLENNPRNAYSSLMESRDEFAMCAFELRQQRSNISFPPSQKVFDLLSYKLASYGSVNDFLPETVPALAQDGDEWWHEDPPGKEDGFFDQCLTGPKMHLARWAGYDERILESMARSGGFWIRRLHKRKYELYFKLEAEFKTAAKRAKQKAKRVKQPAKRVKQTGNDSTSQKDA